MRARGGGALMLYASAHNARAVAASCAVAAALAAVAARIAFPVDLAVFLPPREVPLIELLAVVFAGVAAGLTAPRMVEWEKLGGPRVAVRSALVVLAVAALTLLVVFAGVLALPAEAPWEYLPANAAVFAAVAALARLLAGAVAAPVLTALLFLACCVVQNTLPAIARWLPLSRPHEAPLPVLVPAAALACAVVAAAWTRGLTARAQARTRD
ncbi:hypothetical protein [Actinokineospora sp. NPDC004072]